MTFKHLSQHLELRMAIACLFRLSSMWEYIVASKDGEQYGYYQIIFVAGNRQTFDHPDIGKTSRMLSVWAT